MSGPIVLLEHVACADRAGTGGRARGTLVDVSLRLGEGVVAVLGTPEDGSYALLDVLSGKRAPSRGRVRLDALDPAVAPASRRTLGCLGYEAELPSVGTVAQLVALATSSWPSAAPANARIEQLGLVGLLGRDVESLSYAETRSVELALALAAPAPRLLVLFEPYLDVTVPRAAVEAAIAELAEVAAVVVLTSSPRDARSFGRVVLLERGRLSSAVHDDSAELGGPFGVQLNVVVSSGLRPLAAELARAEATSALSLELGAAEAPGGAGRLRLSGGDRVALGRALALAVEASAASVDAVTESAPELGEVRAMSEWEQHRNAAYAAMRWRAMQHGPADPPAPPPAAASGPAAEEAP